MDRFRHSGNDVFDFSFDGKVWTGREVENGAFAADHQVFNNDGPQEPSGHLFAVTANPHSAGNRAGDDGQRRHKANAALNSSDDGLVLRGVGESVPGGNCLQQCPAMRRPAGQRQVAITRPDLVPGNFPLSRS